MKKTTPPKSGIMKYAPVTTKKKATTGSTTSVASKGAATIKKQPVTSKKPAPAKKLPAKTNAPATGKGVTNLPEVTVTAKRTTTTKPTVSEDKYRYFGGERNTAKPTKELTRAEYSNYYKSKDPKMGLIKIDKADTAKINNLSRSYGASEIKGYVPLKRQTTPAKKKMK
jgi:hypothetical protein